MKNKTLLIMAAGMGSRFGGLKQLQPIGPNKEFMIDYSIYDAIRSGFNKIVFIIKEENYNDFLETIGSRIEKYCENKKVKVEYVFQNLDNIPSGYTIPEERQKPLGTAHAILCAKDIIQEPFVILNADDFYGLDAFEKISKFLDESKEKEIGLVGYDIVNTITANGSVKRGICNVKNGKLETITESSVNVINGQIRAESLQTGHVTYIKPDTKTSMNMISFSPNIFTYLEENLIDFLENNNLEKDEYLIPDVIAKGIKENVYDVTIVNTTSKWVGVTYKEDVDSVSFYIQHLIEDGEYPNKLWD